jgi:hypothetical protein
MTTISIAVEESGSQTAMARDAQSRLDTLQKPYDYDRGGNRAV